LIDWKKCPKCKKWLPGENVLIRHYEFVHIHYTVFEKPYGGGVEFGKTFRE